MRKVPARRMDTGRRLWYGIWEMNFREWGKADIGMKHTVRIGALLAAALLLSALMMTGCGSSGSKPEDFVIEDGVVKGYTGKASDVVIPEGVTAIGREAFRNNAKIRSLAIPASCKSIGYQAFFGCKKLTSVTLPDNGIYIGGMCFESCSKLKDVAIPDSAEFSTQTFPCSSTDRLGLPSPLSVSVGGTIGMLGRVWLSGMHPEDGGLRLSFRESRDSKVLQVTIDQDGQIRQAMNFSFSASLVMEDGTKVAPERAEARVADDSSAYVFDFWYPTDRKPARVEVRGPKGTAEVSGVYWREMKPWMTEG